MKNFELERNLLQDQVQHIQQKENGNFLIQKFLIGTLHHFKFETILFKPFVPLQI